MRVIETSLDEDLSLFSGYLWQQRVRHRVFEERGCQVLEVADAAQAGSVRDAYRAWKAGRLRIEALPGAAGPPTWPRALARYRGLTLLVALAVVAFPFSRPLAEGELSPVAAWLTIIDLRTPLEAPASLLGLLADLEVWRWFTPMLLHFSVLHLAFNCAIVIELGRRVEQSLGGGGLWLLVLLLGGVSNLAQYTFGASPVFGGLSGVAYGLLGFVVTMRRLAPAVATWHLPNGVAVGLLIFLVLFSTGVTEPFGLFVANAAHWAGLLAGAGAALALGRRRAPDA